MACACGTDKKEIKMMRVITRRRCDMLIIRREESVLAAVAPVLQFTSMQQSVCVQ